MELAIVVYLIGMFSTLGGWAATAVSASMWVLILSAIGTFFALGPIQAECNQEEAANLRKYTKTWWKWLSIIALVCVMIDVVVPTKNTMYVMLAAYGTQEVLESETVGKLAPKSVEIIEGYMDKALRELEEEMGETAEAAKEIATDKVGEVTDTVTDAVEEVKDEVVN